MSINNNQSRGNLELNKQTVANLQGQTANNPRQQHRFPVIVPRQSPFQVNKIGWPFEHSDWCDFGVRPVGIGAVA